MSIVIPARDEEECIVSTVEHLSQTMSSRGIDHEILVVDDGSLDRTWSLLQDLRQRIPQLKPLRNEGVHGFGRAVVFGLDHMNGDAAVLVMADESDDCGDVVRYWEELNRGYDCVFGSRFMKGGGTVGYPWTKYLLNRLANHALRIFFGIGYNDFTNAFKAYRREVIEGCRPLISRDFNLTVELPLKSVVRGFRWTVIPVTWRNRRHGVAKFRIREMGSRYLRTCLSIWSEKTVSKRPYQKKPFPGAGCSNGAGPSVSADSDRSNR